MGGSLTVDGCHEDVSSTTSTETIAQFFDTYANGGIVIDISKNNSAHKRRQI